jgi:cytochrome c oxidase subunit 2
MSSGKWVPVLLIAACTVSVVVAAHTHSKAATAQLAQRLAARRTVEAAARAEAQAQVVARYEERVAELKIADRAAALAALPGDPKKGRMLFMTCMACHGLKGEGMRAFKTPRLSGQAPWYLRRQLLKFRDGLRGAHPRDVPGMQMAPMAKLLRNEGRIDNVVAYIASLDPGKPADGSSGDPVTGQAHYTLCVACHGRDAAGIEQQNAPMLAGQHPWYLAKQLKNFQGGLRGYHENDAEGRLMVPIAQLLEDDRAIDDLVAYIRSLDQQ